ncbi:MAG: choice-of-anchor B family protein [Rhodothermaceae bacterium]|nr:choice-of-anchor B family protein [Rhodothermaceae bacterium]MXX57954.1 choice-of-anchor B family protein [Rhodothermaceae bacterium]MYD19968.1 choice-of-anchor B family protein [Rhodothermaceae bacterium]MYD56167.1 choice-of-anchor B family protein [Rhodothermaceae bacterium]MYI43909.1 choice-of-anchor B family protein [Rhodothermaceae bacterium]
MPPPTTGDDPCSCFRARMCAECAVYLVFWEKLTKSMKQLLLLAAGLLITTGAQAQSFGGALAMTDRHVFVGETGNMAFPGEVYIYTLDNLDGAPTILSVNEKLERFGRTIVADGETLLIGAIDADEARGAVYVFKYDDTWQQVARLTASDASPGDQFGTSIAVDGDVVLIGAQGRSESTGAVYVFAKNADGTFSESGVLPVEGINPEDGFGYAVAIEDNIAVVGSPSQMEGMGAAHVFMHGSEGWLQISKLAPDFLTERSRMGSAVMVHKGRVYVSAPMQSLVLEYEWDPESSQLRMRGQLTPFDAQRGSQFGASLAASDSEIWIGDGRSGRGRGVVYRFMSGEEGWTGAMKLMPDEEIGRAAFGSSLALSGDHAVVGAVRMDSRAGGAILVNRSEGEWSAVATLINEVKGYDAITGEEVRCAEGKASRWSCQDVDLTSFLPLPQMGGKRGSRLNDIWGWTDPQTGQEYALVGRNDGTSFVDVTNPELPRYVGDLPMTAGSVPNVWRDIKVYADHAYVVADGAGQHGVQVLDLNQLRKVEGEPVTFTETAHYAGIASAHNIVINEATGFGFVVGASGGGETCGGGLHMIDLRDTPNVSFAGCFADPNTGRRNTGYSHDAQCVTYAGPDLTYNGREICLGSNETALSIADVTDKENPIAISAASYPNVAYTHQGWLTEDHRYFFMNDEGDEPRGLVEGTRTLVWDVSDLDDPVLVTEYIASTPDTDHNLYIKDNLMYQSNYGAGLRILDITNPESPTEIGFFEPGPGSSSWSNYPYFKSGTLIVTSGNEGLFILKKRSVDI